MNLESLLLMRHELLLILAFIVILVAEIFTSESQKKGVIPIAILVLSVITITGFYWPQTGTLFGGMYNTDPLRSAIKSVLDIATILVFMQSYGWMTTERKRNKLSEFYILIISTLIGMDFMISAGDFLMLYLGLELATIPISVLAAFDRYKTQSAEAGIKLILSSALSSGVLLFGLSMIYGTTGSIYFETVTTHISTDAMCMLGMVFFITGMGFKMSVVPFHLWTADVYQGSPIAVTSYLSVVSKGAALFVFAYVMYTVFGGASAIWKQIIVVLSVLTMTIGNLFALRQENMKRFLAFSSIAQAGFMLLGLLADSTTGMGTILFFLLVYVFTNMAAFSIVAVISSETGKENMSDYNGLYQTNPKLSLLLMLALFSLAGIPPVAGFFGKLFLFGAAASAGYYIVLLIAVLNATISLYYYLRPVRAMFIEKNDTPIKTIKSNHLIKIAIIICMVGLIVTGFISGIYEHFIAISSGF